MEQIERSKQKNTSRYFLWYSLLFIVTIVLIYGYFVVSGTSFIWESDGFTQHYLLFKDYVGMWQEFLQHPSAGFQNWDWTIGLGADVIISYGYYVVGDPFVYLGLLFPPSMMEFAFHFLIILRIYCIGLAFIFYARKMGVQGSGLLAGAFVYTFAHYVTLNATRHPFFLMPMLFLPLMCLGVEKILRNESALLFAAVVFISATSNFYFFYKLTVLIFIYAIFRYFELGKSIKQLGQYFWKTLSYYLIGVCMSAVVLFPVIWGFLQSSREPGEFGSGMKLYPLQYYVSLFANVFISESYLWTVLGFAGIVMLVIPLMFVRRKIFGAIPFMLSLFFVMLLFPIFGSIMNGFSGPYNRWTFVIPLLLGIAVARFYQRRFEWTKKDRKAMVVGVVFFGIIAFIPQIIVGFSLARTLPLVAALIVLGAITLAAKVRENEKWSPTWNKVASAVILLSIIGNVVYNAQEYYYPFGQNKMAALLPYGTADAQYEQVFDGVEEQIPPVSEEDIFRIGLTAKDNHIRNHMIYLERMGMTSYLSITNGSVAQFSRQLEIGSFQLIQPVRNGLDDRRIANHLLGVQYIVTAVKNEQYLPYGYEVVYRSEGENGHLVAETEQAYPFAYANSVVMDNAEFELLNPVEKEEYLAEGFTADASELELDRLTSFEGELATKKVEYTIRSEDKEKVTIEDEQVVVQDSDGKLLIEIEDVAEIQNTEVYVQLEGLDFEPKSNQTFKRENTGFNTTVTFNGRNKIIHQSDKLSFSSYIHRKKMLFNLGYQTGEDSNTLTLQFEKLGTYDLKNITIYALPIDENYDEKVAEKRENQLNVTVFENEYIAGSITQEKDTVLVTSIPYSIGWSATVNGEEVEPVKVNYGFIGIPLEAGESQVEFIYQTPFLKLGMTVSVIGFVLYGFEWLRWRKKKRM
ncbi:YfhO family protein [Desemzia sp. RIT804]|uniref:YfhO family protein n=1 Tax=Desemzia sp. RIT 804 TaxID=2810209 RepID=UPI001950DCCF|nr:YfhO family protein [Desemzia sp. RIT 804]MBM6614542.1 YfhO family protein [Desemzia sp. RIT 804]